MTTPGAGKAMRGEYPPPPQRRLAKHLELSKDLLLPPDAVTQTFAFLARRGAGKTYGASKLAEEMIDVGGQVVVIDPIGTWWALRLAADGKGKGFPIPVFGGLHGDVPLEPGAGALVADLVVDRGLALVLDVSMFRKGDRKRFVTDFAEQLFARKKSARSPLHLFLEEAQVFVPQRAMGDEARMLGAFEDLVKLGRNFGIGVTLISQRPQAVNKDALNQTECLVVLQTNGAQERKALRDWIVDQGLNVGELVDALPSLKKGEAYVWSPSWLGLTKRVQIATKRTFNASATPELGGAKQPQARELAPVDLEQIRDAMKEVVARAEETDPKALLKRIRQLEQDLERARAVVPAPERVEVPLLSDGERHALTAAQGIIRTAMEEATAAASALLKSFEAVLERGAAPHPGVVFESPPCKSFAGRPAPAAHDHAEARGASASLPRGARDMLTALAQTYLPSLTRGQVAMLAGLKVTGGTFAKYLSILKTGGFIEARGDQLSISSKGLSAIGGRPPVPQTTEAIVTLWNERLPAGARQMLRVLVDSHPASMARAELAWAVQMEASGGTFAKYLSLLRTSGLVEAAGGQLAASADLFPRRGAA